MKKVVIILSLFLAACSSHQTVGEPQAPLDMKAVEAYNAKVYSGKTVQHKQVKETAVDMPINASDSQPKVSTRGSSRYPVVLMPSIGYHYGYYR
ncbi:hypothetical protein ACT2CV_04845 [Pasteurellaceae bacterium 22721_9_1]